MLTRTIMGGDSVAARIGGAVWQPGWGGQCGSQDGGGGSVAARMGGQCGSQDSVAARMEGQCGSQDSWGMEGQWQPG